MTSARNVFLAPWVGPRYGLARPDVHSRIAERIRARVAPERSLERGLDVGCGTGHSTAPLRDFVEFVLGIDPSRAMLRQAPRGEGVAYGLGRAESMPVRSRSIDLVVTGCAYHWCDAERFIEEAARVLRPRGWLVIYDSHLGGGSAESDALVAWLAREHWGRLPWVARNPLPDPALPAPRGFAFVDSERVEQEVPMPLHRFVEFLTTQSGAVSAIEKGETTLEGLEARLRAGLVHLAGSDGEIRGRFGGPIHFLRRVD